MVKRVSSLQQLLKICFPGEGISDEAKWLQGAADVFKIGIQLRQNIKTLEKNMKTPKGMQSAMQLVLRSCETMTKSKKSITDMQIAITRKWEAGPSERFAALSAELVGMDTYSIFQPIMEADVLYDSMSKSLVAMRQRLEKMVPEAQEIIDPVQGENDWKKDLAEDCSLQDVIGKASSTLLKTRVKGQPWQTMLQTMEEVR